MRFAVRFLRGIQKSPPTRSSDLVCSPNTDRRISRIRVFLRMRFPETKRVVMYLSSRWLKKFGVGVVLASLFGCCMTKALTSVSLDWSPNTDPSVAGYNVYYGTSSRSYTSSINTGDNAQVVIDGLVEGQTYYFAVTAYTFDGYESDYSDEIIYIVPGMLTITPGATSSDPLQIRFPVAPGYTYEVQSSADLQNWTTVWETSDDLNEWVEYDASPSGLGAEYFRVVQY
jgi:hypothetical protein